MSKDVAMSQGTAHLENFNFQVLNVNWRPELYRHLVDAEEEGTIAPSTIEREGGGGREKEERTKLSSN